MEDIHNVSALCSYIGHMILQGDVESVKMLYKTMWRECPALLKTVDELQHYLTSVEIENDTEGIYEMEFLYYWGMICLGEQSDLVTKSLGTAETCFRKIADSVPQAEARLAYIGLLKSTEPAKSERNVHWLEMLRQCANRHRDLFSMIALAKICFYNFLEEQQESAPGVPITVLPIRAMRLLELPCQQGHPVAIRFWRKILDCIENPEAINIQFNGRLIWEDVLCDFQTSANMQTGLVTVEAQEVIVTGTIFN